MAKAPAEDNQEPGIREAVIQLLWEKQFEGTPWAGKFHLVRPSSLVPDYGFFADKIIATVRSHIEECFELKDRRQSVPPTGATRRSDGAEIERTAARIARHFGYDWSKIDSYRTGSCLIPSSNDECNARAEFLEIAKIASGP